MSRLRSRSIALFLIALALAAPAAQAIRITLPTGTTVDVPTPFDPALVPTSCWQPTGPNVPIAGPSEYGDAADVLPTGYVGGGSPIGKFPTLSDTINAFHPGQPGARHTRTDVAWLGNQTLYAPGAWAPIASGDIEPTSELDADSLPDEDGTRTNFQNGVADRDGYDDGLAPVSLYASATGQFRIRVTAAQHMGDMLVNILVDWNFDGRWRNVPGQPPEWAVQNMWVGHGSPSSREYVTPTFATGSLPGQPWVRVTLSPRAIDPALYGAAGWNGEVPPGTVDQLGVRAFACGETEDYCGSVYLRDPIRKNESASPPPGTMGCKPREPQPPPPPPPPPPCGPKDAWAQVVGVSSGGTPASYGPSPWTFIAGFGVPLADMQSFGADITIEYCNVEAWMPVDKVFAPSGTSPSGPREFFPGWFACGLNTIVLHLDYAASYGPIDQGDYSMILSWGATCGPTGSGTTPERLFVT